MLFTVLTLIVACESSEDTRSCDAPDMRCFTSDWEITADPFTFTLQSASPIFPERGLNTWSILISNQGTPALGCTLIVTPYMPEHMHGVPTPPVVTEQDNGSYELADINLTMPGLWELQFELTCPDSAEPTETSYLFWLDG